MLFAYGCAYSTGLEKQTMYDLLQVACQVTSLWNSLVFVHMVPSPLSSWQQSRVTKISYGN